MLQYFQNLIKNLIITKTKKKQYSLKNSAKSTKNQKKQLFFIFIYTKIEYKRN